MTIDQPGRAVCAEGNPWNPDFTCAKDAGHDGDHWSPTGPVTSSAQTPEPTDEQRAMAMDSLQFDPPFFLLDPDDKELVDRVARALAAAVQQERDKVEAVLRNAEKTLSDDDPMAYGQGWYDGQTTIISRIREVSR